MRGVAWVDSDYQAFLNALREFQTILEYFRAEAKEQAKHFGAYSIESTIPKIVDGVLGPVQAR